MANEQNERLQRFWTLARASDRREVVGAGVLAAVAAGVVVIASIVAANSGPACTGSDATWECTDRFGNGGGDDLCGTDGGSNLQVDPQFCAVDPAASLFCDL